MPLDQDDLIAIALAVALRRKKRRLKWTKDWLLKRHQMSHTNLLADLKLEPDDWRNYLRMDEGTYIDLLNRVTPFITYEDTSMRKAITPHERLSVTLRYLATGRSLNDMKYSAIISTSALSSIIPETCDALYRVLQKEYLKVRNTL